MPLYHMIYECRKFDNLKMWQQRVEWTQGPQYIWIEKQIISYKIKNRVFGTVDPAVLVLIHNR